MIEGRRALIVTIPVNAFADFLSGRLLGPVLPRDVRATRVFYDLSLDGISVMLESSEFPFTPTGHVIPNGNFQFTQRPEFHP